MGGVETGDLWRALVMQCSQEVCSEFRKRPSPKAKGESNWERQLMLTSDPYTPMYTVHAYWYIHVHTGI